MTLRRLDRDTHKTHKNMQHCQCHQALNMHTKNLFDWGWQQQVICSLSWIYFCSLYIVNVILFWLWDSDHPFIKKISVITIAYSYRLASVQFQSIFYAPFLKKQCTLSDQTCSVMLLVLTYLYFVLWFFPLSVTNSESNFWYCVEMCFFNSLQ